MHIRGSLQTVDLATGRIFSASPIIDDSVLTNESTNGRPEFPSEQMMRDRAIDRAAYDVSTMFVNWTEEKKLYFFNEKDCNLNLAFALLKAGDFRGTVRQSVENIATCTAWPKAKDSNLAHAYYNAGLAYLLVNDHQKAISYLTESQKMKGGEIVRQTIAEADNSARTRSRDAGPSPSGPKSLNSRRPTVRPTPNRRQPARRGYQRFQFSIGLSGRPVEETRQPLQERSDFEGRLRSQEEGDPQEPLSSGNAFPNRDRYSFICRPSPLPLYKRRGEEPWPLPSIRSPCLFLTVHHLSRRRIENQPAVLLSFG